MWMSGEYSGEGEFQGESFETAFEGYGEMPLNEMQEMELATELLGVTNENELDQFLGGLIKKVGGFVKGPIGQALGGVLKGVAKKALPIVGGALGSMVAPGVGTAIGSSLGSMAGKMFGLELEALSSEDREFEVARRYVRLAATAARKAASAPPTLSPQIVARKALAYAAGKHAPGLYSQIVSAPQCPAPQQRNNYWSGIAGEPSWGAASSPASGRWVRSGNKIVILGV